MLRKSERTAGWNQPLGEPRLSPSSLPTEPRSKLFQSQHSSSPRSLKAWAESVQWEELAQASEQTGWQREGFVFLQEAKEKSDLAPGPVKEQNMKIRKTDRGQTAAVKCLGEMGEQRCV